MIERVFNIDEVMTAISRPRRTKKTVTLDDGIEITYNQKLRLFRKFFISKGRIKCDVCGIEGDIFVVKKGSKSGKCYVTLINERHDIEMTRDHIEPLCNGGTDSLDNQIPMCQICNNNWKSKFDEGRI